MIRSGVVLSTSITRRSLLLVPLVAGGWMLQARTAPGESGSPQLLEGVMRLVSERFVDTVGAGALYERAARGLVKELNDPYSELFTPKQIADFTRNTNGRYAGIGMEITAPQGGYVTVARVFPHSPAEGAGAAALAALLRERDQAPALVRGRRLAVVLCGGNVDADVFARVLAGADA